MKFIFYSVDKPYQSVSNEIITIGVIKTKKTLIDI